MSEPQVERISIREFSRRVGVSDTAIHKAMRSERLVASIIRSPDGKVSGLDAAVAMQEWQQSQNPNYGRSPMQPPAPTQATAAAPLPGSDMSDGSLANAKRAQAILKARQMDLELKKAQGAVVEKAAVYRALFAAGQEIRAGILAVPDRVIDELLSCRTRAEAHALLSDTLYQTLDTLSVIYKREIAP